jgi:hypothetical protein
MANLGTDVTAVTGGRERIGFVQKRLASRRLARVSAENARGNADCVRVLPTRSEGLTSATYAGACGAHGSGHCQRALSVTGAFPS